MFTTSLWTGRRQGSSLSPYKYSGLDILASSSGHECTLSSIQCRVDSSSVPLNCGLHWVSCACSRPERATKYLGAMLTWVFRRVTEFGATEAIYGAKSMGSVCAPMGAQGNAHSPPVPPPKLRRRCGIIKEGSGLWFALLSYLACPFLLFLGSQSGGMEWTGEPGTKQSAV